MQVLWLRFLTEINEHTREVPPELLANPEVKKAVNAVEESAFTEAQLLGYEKFWDIISVEKTLYNSAIRKGMAKGIKEGMTKGIEVGRAEGIVEGIEKEKLVIARQMKVDGLPYDTISSSLPCPRELLRYGDGELAADSQFTFQPDTSSVCTNYFVDKSQA